ncbi:Lethal(2) giant larvae sro7 [Thecaphora frezii]
MPPSWVRTLRDHVPQGVKLPEALSYADWSGSLTNTHLSPTGNFNEGILAGLALPGEVSAMAFEPVRGYLAVGTTQGTVHLFGSPPVHLSFTLRPAQKVRHLAFKSGTGLLVCIDDKDNMSIYDLERPDPQIRAAHASSSNQYRASSASMGNTLTGPPHPDTPMRVGIHTIRNKVMCIELSPAHSHLFLGLRDGTIDTYDLERFCPSPYRVPNLWWEEEEILRKSGVPDAPNRRHVPLIIDIKSHPKNLNQLLLAYEGGAILLDIKERAVLKTFQLRLLPGAPGAGGDPNLVWTERSAPATCISWRPDGQVFAMGHEDGCISFWNVAEDEKPIMVRTLEQVDVEKPSATLEALEAPRPPREPIFKLAWSGFPEKSWISMAGESAAAWQTSPAGNRSPTEARQTEQQEEAAAPTKGTVLTVLGGAVEGRDPPALYCIHFAPYAAPISLWSSGGAEASAKLRQSLRQSLQSTAESVYRTPSLVEDFLLLPKISPHYSGSYDPMAVVTLLAADPALPTLPPPAAVRGLACYAFPPRLAAHTSPAGGATSPRESLSGPNLGSGTTAAAVLPNAWVSSPPQKELDLPLALTLAGAGAILGAKFETMSPHAYRKLVGLDDVTGLNQKQQQESESVALRSSQDPRKGRLELLGGKASASLSGDGYETIPDLARSSKFRILITWHLDGSVRFHDASPHLQLLGEIDSDDAVLDPSLPPRLWLKRSFPSPLPHLTISTRRLLGHEQMVGHPTFDRIRHRAKVQDVQLASDVLEVGIALSSGQLLQYRFDFAKLSETQAIYDLVEREISEEQAAHLAIPPVKSPRSEAGSPLGSHALAASSGLDDEMASAMRELDTDAPLQDAPAPSAPPTERRGCSEAATGMVHDAQTRTLAPSQSGPESVGSLHDVSLAAAPPERSRTPPQAVGGAPPPRPKRDPKRLSMLFGRKREPTSGSGATIPPSGSTASIPEHEATASAASPAAPPPPRRQSVQATQAAEPAAEEITYLGHLAEWYCDGFKPNLMIDPMRGEITAFSVSDIGFLAIACGTVLAVVDLRGPELILREGFGDQFDAARQAKEGGARDVRKVLEAEAKSAIASLTFSVCRVAEDPSLAPRLIVSRADGYTTIWTLQKTLDMWMVERTSGAKLDELAGLCKMQILDMAGNVCPALPNELQRALREQQHGPIGAEEPPDCYLALGFTDKRISLRFGITGPVVATVDVGEKVLGAGVVERASEKVAVVVTSSSIRIFSLPKLQQIVRLQRHHRELGETTGSFASISFDAHGDFVEVCSSLDVRLWTVFGSLKRPGQPNLTLCPTPAPAGRTMPLYPGAVGSAVGVATSIAGWFGTKAGGALSAGAQLDSLLAGSNRPDPPKLGDPLPPRDFRVRASDIPANSAGAQQTGASRRTAESNGSSSGGGGGGGGKARAVADETQQAAGYGFQNIDLLKARGAMMSGIEEGLNSLEKGASDFVKNTRDMAIKSAAKDKLNKFLF